MRTIFRKIPLRYNLEGLHRGIVPSRPLLVLLRPLPLLLPPALMILVEVELLQLQLAELWQFQLAESSLEPQES